LRSATLDAKYHLARVTLGAAAAAATLDSVKRELKWECPEKMYEQVTRDDLFVYHRCTVFMYAGVEEGFQQSTAQLPLQLLSAQRKVPGCFSLC
jgi:hypothetical protein